MDPQKLKNLILEELQAAHASYGTLDPSDCEKHRDLNTTIQMVVMEIIDKSHPLDLKQAIHHNDLNGAMDRFIERS